MSIDWNEAERARGLLRRLFDVAVQSADPRRVLARHLPEPPRGRCVVVGAGKASALMAQALEEAWPDVPMEGLIVTRDGYAAPTRRIAIVEASHPVPDARSEEAARRILAMVEGLTADDLVLALVSGGGSATMVLPAPGLTLEDKIAVHRALLRSGATIGEMNRVRGVLSGIKAGRLARAAAPARVVTLTISDVPGDRPEEIASGPTAGGPASRAEALAIVRRYGMLLPAAVMAYLAAPEPPPLPPVPADIRMIAAPWMALEAVTRAAGAEGIATLTLGDAIEGEARELGTVMAGIARSVATRGLPARAPLLLLSGGETTVTIRDTAGRGGRNTEYLLALAVALAGEKRIWALAGDTDGIDGSDDAAGALIGPDTLARARAAGLDPRAMLDGHDSYSLFRAIGDLVVTGPTFTNVNDFRAVLVA
jgi:hydroxypyruvate reductase